MLRGMKTKLLSLTAVLALVAAAPAAAKPVKYSGKTKDGSKINFVLSHGKISKISTVVPGLCLSAQGGSPEAGGEIFNPPGGFALGKSVKRKAEKQDSTLAYFDVTKNYTVTTHRSGKKITGDLAENWAWTLVTWPPKLYTCVGNSHFSAKPL
jgi:hypothetical protein